MNNMNNKKASSSSKTKEKKYQFIAIPYEHMALKKIISVEELAFLGLVRNLSTTIQCVAMNSYLAEIMHVSERTIGRYIKNLVDLDLLIYEKNSKTKSNRILKVNETKIVELLKGGQDCPPTNKNEKIDDEVDKNVYKDGQGSLISLDKSCFENDENDCNLNNNRNLIDNIINKEIDNISSADAEQTATAVETADAVSLKTSIAEEMEKIDCREIYNWYHFSSFKEAINHFYNKFKDIELEKSEVEKKKEIALIMQRKLKEFIESTSVREEMEKIELIYVIDRCLYYKEEKGDDWRKYVIDAYYRDLKDIEDDKKEEEIKEIISIVLDKRIEEFKQLEEPSLIIEENELFM